MKNKHIKAYMECAEAFAKCSNATRLRVGCVIVKDNKIISCGYNAQPEHIDDPCELENGTTDPRVRHAEKNALMGLIRSNQSAVDAVMFVTHACCEFCAIDIVDSGIKKVYYKHPYRLTTGIDYLVKNGVEVVQLTEETNETSNEMAPSLYPRYSCGCSDGKCTKDIRESSYWEQAARDAINRTDEKR